jgi:sodium-coupled neutral amino acid transporter 11
MECHVARHVISSLWYGGESDDPIEKNVKVCETQLCLKRRHVITIAVYLCTLVPALIWNNLGSILSFTGTIGGSCICYIAPGLIYLGVYGESFVARCHSFLSKQPNDPEEAVTEEVEGDWSLEYHRGCKPW